MRVATIDIGTNSVLLLIARADSVDPTRMVALHEASTITRLGQGVDATGRLHVDAVQRTLACLSDYADRIRAHNVARVCAVSTSAARDAVGVDGFLDAAESVLGVRPTVISGVREAELTFRGALTGLGLRGPVTVFDIGGGSTEVVFGHADPPRAGHAMSLDVGCVRLTERHLRSDPPSSQQIADAWESAATTFATLRPASGTCAWVGIGGTVTTLASVEAQLAAYDASRIHGSVLTRSSVHAVRQRLAGIGLEDRSNVRGLEPKRADVIVAGALLVEALLDRVGQSACTVSDRGVRWGLAIEACSTTDAGRSTHGAPTTTKPD